MEDNPWRQWQAFAAQAASAPTGASAFAPFTDAAERFSAAARSFLEGSAAPSVAGAADAARIFSDFLREQFDDLGHMPWTAPQGAAGHAAASPMDTPALGATREHQQRLQRAAEAWQRMQEAQRRLQRLWSDALREASTAFAARHGTPQSVPTTAEALNALYDSWIDCAEDAYSRTAHSEAFCNALGDFVNAGSEWRQAQQAGIEHWAKPFDLPTRSEINSLTQRLEAVEKQLRAASKPARKPAGKPAAKPGRGRRKSKS